MLFISNASSQRKLIFKRSVLVLVGMIAVGVLSISGCGQTMTVKAEKDQNGATDAAKAPVEQKSPDPKSAIKEAAPEGQTFSLQEISVKEEHGQTTLLIRFSAFVNEYRHFPLTQPARIVLDVFGDSKPISQVETFRVDANWVAILRSSSGQGFHRLTLELSSATVPPYEIQPEAGGIRLVIGSFNPQATAKKELKLVESGKRVSFQEGPILEKEYKEPTVSLIFKDADPKNVFRLLAQVGGKNLIVTDDVTRRITIHLEEPIPWDQALDLLLDINGLEKDVVGNVIRISTVSRLRQEREARAAAEKAKELVGSIQTAYLRVNYARVRELATKIEKIKTASGTIVFDELSNTILVRDVSRVIEEAKAIVKAFDVRTTQILIESNLIETSPTFARALGIELNLTYKALAIQTGFTADPPFQLGRPGTPTIPGSGGTETVIGTPPVPPLGLQITGKQDRLGPFRDVTAILSAAEQEGNIKTISRPSVVTLNNVASTIQSLRILRVALPSSTNIASGTGAAAGAAVATEKINVGITLTVTPQVSSDGFILLTISVRSSTLGSQSPGSIVPDELSREALANILVRDGETIVIGGIMKDTSAESETGVPWLRNIPVLGWLFKKIRLQKDFEELMVFITPRIIASGSQDLPSAEQLWREKLRKTEGG